MIQDKDLTNHMVKELSWYSMMTIANKFAAMWNVTKYSNLDTMFISHESLTDLKFTIKKGPKSATLQIIYL